MLKQFFKTKQKFQTPTIGANSQITSQLNSLEIEKDILTKTIARLYENKSDLTKIQKDRLLLKYQHQLGVVIARIEKLQSASKHPDLGPLGDGLITLMDQKLSQLDQRLYELTTKIQVAQEDSDQKIPEKPKKNEKKAEEKHKPVFEKPLEQFVNKESKKFEITTLTALPKLDPVKQTKYDQMLSQLNSDVITPPSKPKMQEKPTIEAKPIQQEIVPVSEKPEPIVEQIAKSTVSEIPKPVLDLPEESDIEEDDDDIEQIKSKILKTLSKIEQAEVD